MKYSETNEEMRQHRMKYIDERWGQLSNMAQEASQRAVNLLFLINSGGAVAMLSFMGASEKIRTLAGPKYSLGIFVLGIILTAILNAYILHRLEWIFTNWRKDVRGYYEDQINWQDLNKADDERSWSNNIEYVLGYAAFACFIVGAIFGCFWGMTISA